MHHAALLQIEGRRFCQCLELASVPVYQTDFGDVRTQGAVVVEIGLEREMTLICGVPRVDAVVAEEVMQGTLRHRLDVHSSSSTASGRDMKSVSPTVHPRSVAA